MNDCIMMTSFNFVPLHSWTGIEVPDNWSWKKSFNVSLEELIETIDNAINNDYTVVRAVHVI